MAMAILVHIWKALPFWTLILMAGRLAIPKELYEAASVDGASGWQKFRYVTWPSIRTLYLTSTLLSLIWTLGDFNSVYLLTGGQPADQRSEERRVGKEGRSRWAREGARKGSERRLAIRR